MSGSGGIHWRHGGALLAAVLAVSGLVGCEYADDVGLSSSPDSPSARSFPSRPPLPTQDPQLAIVEARNMADLDRILGAPAEELLIGGAGGLGGSGFRTSIRTADKGIYTVTVACVGAPDAHLSISQDIRRGGPGLELDLDCGTLTEAMVDLEAGAVWAQLTRRSMNPGTGGVAGIRVVPANPKS